MEFSFDAVSEDSAGSQDTQTHGSTQPGGDVLRYVDPAPFVPRMRDRETGGVRRYYPFRPWVLRSVWSTRDAMKQ